MGISLSDLPEDLRRRILRSDPILLRESEQALEENRIPLTAALMAAEESTRKLLAHGIEPDPKHLKNIETVRSFLNGDITLLEMGLYLR